MQPGCCGPRGAAKRYPDGSRKAGKYEGLDDALALVRHGGFFIGDDMLQQANWPNNHQERADGLVTYLEGLQGWTTVALCWGSGFVISVRS
jgi:hypothetical protein